MFGVAGGLRAEPRLVGRRQSIKREQNATKKRAAANRGRSEVLMGDDQYRSPCAVVRQSSQSACTFGTTFGCEGVEGETRAVWISGGCRGTFRCGVDMVVRCGRRANDFRLQCACKSERAANTLAALQFWNQRTKLNVQRQSVHAIAPAAHAWAIARCSRVTSHGRAAEDACSSALPQPALAAIACCGSIPEMPSPSGHGAASCLSTVQGCKRWFTATGANVSHATLPEAEAECLAQGRRLCSAEELRAGQGCTFDRREAATHLWTRSPCGASTTAFRLHEEPYKVIRSFGSCQAQLRGLVLSVYYRISFSDCLQRCDAWGSVSPDGRRRHPCKTVGYSFIFGTCALQRASVGVILVLHRICPPHDVKRARHRTTSNGRDSS